MKRLCIVVLIVLFIMSGSMAAGYCESFYAPTFFASDKEALEVLQSLKGSFFAWSNYPKQTIQIDRYGLRLFSEYIGTKKVWNTWEMYYMTVPDLRSENATLVFKNVSRLSVFKRIEAAAANPWCVTQDSLVATTFCMKDEATARRFADAAATLSVAAGAQWGIRGGWEAPTSEQWFRNKLNWKKETGAVLKTVTTGYPMAAAGLQNEDIVLTFAGKEVKDSKMLSKLQQDLLAVRAFEIKVPVSIFRKGAVLNKEIVFYDYNAKAGAVQKLLDKPAVVIQQPAVQKPKLGASIRAVTEEDVKALNLPSAAGALVTGIDSDSNAQRMKLMVNDLILEVNGVEIKNCEHLQMVVSGAASINKIRVRRGEDSVELVMPISI